MLRGLLGEVVGPSLDHAFQHAVEGDCSPGVEVGRGGRHSLNGLYQVADDVVAQQRAREAERPVDVHVFHGLADDSSGLVSQGVPPALP